MKKARDPPRGFYRRARSNQRKVTGEVACISRIAGVAAAAPVAVAFASPVPGGPAAIRRDRLRIPAGEPGPRRGSSGSAPSAVKATGAIRFTADPANQRPDFHVLIEEFRDIEACQRRAHDCIAQLVATPYRRSPRRASLSRFAALSLARSGARAVRESRRVPLPARSARNRSARPLLRQRNPATRRAHRHERYLYGSLPPTARATGR